MNIFSKLFGTICLAVILCSSVQANLILNGSFEDTGTVSPSSATWQIYASIPNWDNTRGIEIWNDGFIVPAYHGNNVLELNAHSSDISSAYSIFQFFSTVVGQQYELTFAGRKRQSNSDERFSVSVGDLAVSVINQAHGNWNEYSYTFTAAGTSSQLTFTSLDNRSDTRGNLFDEVSVKSIPEPGSLLLILLGLAGLVVTRKQYF
jgi:hypothetical protein